MAKRNKKTMIWIEGPYHVDLGLALQKAAEKATSWLTSNPQLDICTMTSSKKRDRTTGLHRVEYREE